MNISWALSISYMSFGALFETYEGLFWYSSWLPLGCFYHWPSHCHPSPAFYENLLIGLCTGSCLILPQRSEQSFLSMPDHISPAQNPVVTSHPPMSMRYSQWGGIAHQGMFGKFAVSLFWMFHGRVAFSVCGPGLLVCSTDSLTIKDCLSSCMTFFFKSSFEV